MAGVDIVLGIGQWLYSNARSVHAKYMQYKNKTKKGPVMEAYEDACMGLMRQLVSDENHSIEDWVQCKKKLLEMQEEAQRTHWYWKTEFRDMTSMMPLKPAPKQRKLRGVKQKRYDPSDDNPFVDARHLYTKEQFLELYGAEGNEAWNEAVPERRMVPGPSLDKHGNQNDFERYFGMDWLAVWRSAQPAKFNLDDLDY